MGFRIRPSTETPRTVILVGIAGLHRIMQEVAPVAIERQTRRHQHRTKHGVTSNHLERDTGLVAR